MGNGHWFDLERDKHSNVILIIILFVIIAMVIISRRILFISIRGKGGQRFDVNSDKPPIPPLTRALHTNTQKSKHPKQSTLTCNFSNRKQIVKIHQVLAFQKKRNQNPNVCVFFQGFPKDPQTELEKWK